MLNYYDSIVTKIIEEFDLKNPTQFCKMLDLSPTNIYSWKGGSLPNIEVIRRIKKKFPSLSTEWLVMEEGEMYAKTENKRQNNDDIEIQDFLFYAKKVLEKIEEMDEAIKKLKSEKS